MFAEIGHPRPDPFRWCIDRHGDFPAGHTSLLAGLLAGDEPYADVVAPGVGTTPAVTQLFDVADLTGTRFRSSTWREEIGEGVVRHDRTPHQTSTTAPRGGRTLSIALLLPPASASGDVRARTVASGLNNPRGIFLVSGRSYFVAEGGTGGSGPCQPGPFGTICVGQTGAVTHVRNGSLDRIVNLPSIASPDGSFAFGPARRRNGRRRRPLRDGGSRRRPRVPGRVRPGRR